MNIEEIRKYMPHRYPFLLVDRVIEIELDKYIKEYKNITNNEPYFIGHFPEKSVVPGVLILEAMAQASGILGFKTMNCLRCSMMLSYVTKSFDCTSCEGPHWFPCEMPTFAQRQQPHSLESES